MYSENILSNQKVNHSLWCWIPDCTRSKNWSIKEWWVTLIIERFYQRKKIFLSKKISLYGDQLITEDMVNQNCIKENNCISQICENTGIFSRKKTESTILSLCGKMWAIENPYSCIFKYAQIFEYYLDIKEYSSPGWTWLDLS